MTEHEAAEILALLAAAFPAREIQPEMLSVYHQHLADLPYQDVRGAVHDLIRTEEWFPSVGKIRRHLASRSLGLLGAEEELHRLENGGSPSDRVSALALDAAGIRPEFMDDIAWWRRSFLKSYRELAERELERVSRGEPAIEALPSGRRESIEDGEPRSIRELSGGLIDSDEEA